MAKTDVKEPEQDKEIISVRLYWPTDVHGKIRKHQRQMAIKLDRMVTFEEASIDFIRTSDVVKKS